MIIHEIPVYKFISQCKGSMLPMYCRSTACVIGNVKNRSTKLGKEYADADHKFSTTPPSTEKSV